MQRAQTGLQVLFFILSLAYTNMVPALDSSTAPVDPAETLREQIFKLTPDEEKACRELFQKLADPDFETRDNAINRLILRGPAVIKIAQEFYEHKDNEIANAAKNLPGRIALEFPGYLPPDPELLKKLDEPWSSSEHKVGENLSTEDYVNLLKKFIKEECESAKIPLLLLPESVPNIQPTGMGGGKTRRERLQFYAALTGAVFMPRGSVLVISSPARAQKFNTPAHTFKWKHLGMDRDEADRVSEALKSFFLPGTEIHAGGESITIRSVTETFPRAARLIALLEPGAPPALWPKPTAGENTNTEIKLNTARISEHLQRPVTVNLSSDEPLLVIQDFRKQKAEISLWAEGREFAQPPYPREMRGLAPLSLKLKDTPLGLALRWLERRAAFAGANQKGQMLQAAVNDEGRTLLYVGEKNAGLLATRVAGVDVGGLDPAADKLAPPQADAALAKLLEEKLRPELDLFPDFDWETDAKVLRKRLILQGNTPVVQRALELVEQWKTTGKPPACAWQSKLEEKLNREVDWNGQNQGVESLLPRLRQLGTVSLLLEPGPDGTMPEFDLSKRQAELLWPGKYPFKALLDDLAKKARAKWEIKWGAVVLMPAQKEKEPEKPANP